MSEPAAFAIIRDGQKRFYGDRWVGALLHRDLVWGPEAFETWLLTLSELDEWYDDVDGGAVVDFDRRRLTWCTPGELLSVPKVAAVYGQLLAKAWPRFEIVAATSSYELTETLGLPVGSPEDQEQYKLEDRSQSIRGAMGEDEDDLDNDEDEDHRDDEDETADVDKEAQSEPLSYEFDDDELRAWVTITDADGSIRHRQLLELSLDLLKGVPQALADLKQLPAGEIPKEEVVKEGMWIEEAERTIGLWGGAKTKAAFALVEKSWKDWDVQWAQRGYVQHCAATGPSGQPLSIEQALVKVVPMLLSTERFDMSTFFGAIGGSLKKTAMKATGCLLIVICSPLLIFGAISGNWTAVLITVAVVVVLVAVIFKVLERKVARSMKSSLSRGQAEPTGPATAGPLDADARRQALDQLLAAAGFPPIKKLEPNFPPKNELGLPM